MPLPSFMTKRKKPDIGNDQNSNARLQKDGLRKFSLSSNKTNTSSNYVNNNTTGLAHAQPQNKSILPLEGFPDPPYDETNLPAVSNIVYKRLCRNFQDIIDSADTHGNSASSRSSTPLQSEHTEFITLIQYFQQFLKRKGLEDGNDRALNLLQFLLDVRALKALFNSVDDTDNANIPSSIRQQERDALKHSKLPHDESNCDIVTQFDTRKSKPSLNCDNLKEHQNNQNDTTYKNRANLEHKASSHDGFSPKIIREREFGSIISSDSGIVTSPTTSHASQNSNQSTCHSSLTAISSEVIEDCVENQSDDINGNLNLGAQDNAAHCESPNTDIGIRDTCTQMALAIYQSYIAPDSPLDIVSELRFVKSNDSNVITRSTPNNLTREHVNSIISTMCPEKDSGENNSNGISNNNYFDSSALHVSSLLEKGYYHEFMQSSFYAKYQLQILSKEPSTANGNINLDSSGRKTIASIPDIFKNDSLLSSFMEFMDSSHVYTPGRSLIEFWLCASNYRELFNESNDDKEANIDSIDDAVGIYNRFVSMEATNPLGFSSGVRSRIEDRICEDSRNDNDGKQKNTSRACFNEAISIVEAALTEKYLPKFFSSNMFKNYVTGLQAAAISEDSTKKLSVDSLKANPSGNKDKLRRADSSNSLNTSYSSEYGLNTSISLSNTLLADGSIVGRRGTKRTGTDFLSRYNLDPNRLWKRKQYRISNIGHVDHLGRYRSCYTKVPDHGATKSTVSTSGSTAPMSRRLSTAMRRLVVSEAEDQMREEMAWQNAQTILEDVRENLTRSKNFNIPTG